MNESNNSQPELSKTQLLKELFGVWKDVEDDIIQLIYDSRSISRDKTDFEELN